MPQPPAAGGQPLLAAVADGAGFAVLAILADLAALATLEALADLAALAVLAALADLAALAVFAALADLAALAVFATLAVFVALADLATFANLAAPGSPGRLGSLCRLRLLWADPLTSRGGIGTKRAINGVRATSGRLTTSEFTCPTRRACRAMTVVMGPSRGNAHSSAECNIGCRFHDLSLSLSLSLSSLPPLHAVFGP